MDLATLSCNGPGTSQDQESLERLVELLEGLGCAVSDVAHCEGTDVFSLRLLCSARRMGERLGI